MMQTKVEILINNLLFYAENKNAWYIRQHAMLLLESALQLADQNINRLVVQSILNISTHLTQMHQSGLANDLLEMAVKITLKDNLHNEQATLSTEIGRLLASPLERHRSKGIR